jgi:hypothetical protein
LPSHWPDDLAVTILDEIDQRRIVLHAIVGERGISIDHLLDCRLAGTKRE